MVIGGTEMVWERKHFLPLFCMEGAKRGPPGHGMLGDLGP